MNGVPVNQLIIQHKLCNVSTGERKPLSYVGSDAQAQDLQASNTRLMRAFHAVDITGEEDDEDSDNESPDVRNKLLQTVKLHHVIDHAPADILAHGHEKHYSAQASSLLFFCRGCCATRLCGCFI